MPNTQVSLPQHVPTSKGSLQWWAAGLMFGVSLIAWLAIYGPYFDAQAPAVGHDFSLLAPALLDGSIFFWKNGPFFLPWFTPAFCGGQPLLADPQSVYLSPLQWLSFVVPPMQASAYFSFGCAALAYWGFFCLARKGFGFNVWVASFAGVFGCLHGFLPHRLITGEAGFGAYALFGYIATLILCVSSRPEIAMRGVGAKPSAVERFKHWFLCWDFGAWGLGFLGANWILWGGLSLLPVALLSLMALVLMKRAMMGPLLWGRIALRALKGGVWFVALVAFQISASFAVLSQFPRLSPAWPGFDSFWMALRSTGLSLVLSGERQALLFNPLLKDSPWAVFPMEWAQNFGWMPWFFAGVASLFLLMGRSTRATRLLPRFLSSIFWVAPAFPCGRSETMVRRGCALACALLLFFPVLLFWHNPHWVAWLKHLPFFQSSSWPFRWTLLDVAPVGLLLAWPIGELARKMERRFFIAPLALSLLLCALVWISSAMEPRDFYGERTLGYTGAQTIESTWAQARSTPSRFDIQSIGPTLGRVLANPSLANAQRNNLVAFGESAQLCYNPLFGYRAESDPGRHLGIGPVFPVAGSQSIGMQSQPLPISTEALSLERESLPSSSSSSSTAALSSTGGRGVHNAHEHDAHDPSALTVGSLSAQGGMSSLSTSKPLAAINLLNPACEAWPDANGCRPGARFLESQRTQAEAFAQRRPFSFSVSPRQRWSQRLSAMAWSLWLGLGVLLLLRTIWHGHQRLRKGTLRVGLSFLTRDLGSQLGRSSSPHPSLMKSKPCPANASSMAAGAMLEPSEHKLNAHRWGLAWGLALAAALSGCVAFLVVFGSGDNPLVWDDETIFSNPAYGTAAPLLPALKAGFSLFPTLYWRPLGLLTLLLPLHWHCSLVAQQEVREGLWVFTAMLIALAGTLAFAVGQRERSVHGSISSRATRFRLAAAVFSGVLASAFWSLGSVNAEPAQWLSARFDLLCATFLALWLAWAFGERLQSHHRALLRQTSGWRWKFSSLIAMSVSLLCALAAFLSKDFAPGFFCVAMPFALWMGIHPPKTSTIDFAKKDSFWRRFSALIGLALGGGLGAMARHLALGSGVWAQPMDATWRWTASAASAARYVLELLNWPGLGLDRPVLYWSATPAWSMSWSLLFWVGAACLCIGLLVKALRSSHFAWILVFGALSGTLFYGAMLLLGAYSSQTWVSERYLTAPLLALGMALCVPLVNIFERLSQACTLGSRTARMSRLLLIFGLGSLGLLGLIQSKQNQVLFSNAIEFWHHAAQLPNAPIDAKNNYLSQLAGNNHSAQAIAYGEQLLGHRAPSRELIRPATNLALAYASQGEFEKALNLEERYSSSGYTSAAMEANRASQLLLMGRCDEAISTLTMALNMQGTIDGPALASIKASSRPRLLAMYAVCRPQEFEAKKREYMAAGHLSERDLTSLGLPAYIASAQKALERASVLPHRPSSPSNTP